VPVTIENRRGFSRELRRQPHAVLITLSRDVRHCTPLSYLIQGNQRRMKNAMGTNLLDLRIAGSSDRKIRPWSPSHVMRSDNQGSTSRRSFHPPNVSGGRHEVSAERLGISTHRPPGPESFAACRRFRFWLAARMPASFAVLMVGGIARRQRAPGPVRVRTLSGFPVRVFIREGPPHP